MSKTDLLKPEMPMEPDVLREIPLLGSAIALSVPLLLIGVTAITRVMP